MQPDLLDISKEEYGQISPAMCLNFNIGVLGHVDSGKTSICKLLSQVISTASLDRNPQSQQRGITLDLGFSAFITRMPVRFINQVKEKYLQVTLVDCPGHASLIRTIIGGAQIIDMMLLIIDITKGIQAQTAECIIIAELLSPKIIVVLNKVDLLDAKSIELKVNGLKKVFAKTKFGENVTMTFFSAKIEDQNYTHKLKEVLLDKMELPARNIDGKFLYLIDHCFKIKGKGTVITGTVVEGRIKAGDQLELCEIQQKCKIKSMEMFKKGIQVARQGDRVAMLMHHLEADLVQRGVACTPGYLRRVNRVIIDLNLVRLYKRPIKNKSRFNIMSGHQTIEGELRLFVAKQGKLEPDAAYLALNQIGGEINPGLIQGTLFAVINLEQGFFTRIGFRVLGYKPDIDNDQKACRIAFHGTIQAVLEKEQQLRLYKEKQKTGIVDRVVDNYSLIAKDLFEKDANVQVFVGKDIILEANGMIGRIEGPFGKSGKVKVQFKEELPPELQGTTLLFKFTKWYN